MTILDRHPHADLFNENGELNEAAVQMVYERTKAWPPKQKAAFSLWLKQARTRAKIKRQYANAAELARAVDPEFKITPGLDLIATAIETTLAKPRHNLLVTMPPQEGKSSLVSVWTPIRALQLNPNRRIILASYGDTLAETHSMACRDVIRNHGTDVEDPLTGIKIDDKIGLKLKGRKVGSWGIEGGKGGMHAVGLGSAITGRAADLFIIDDPYKNMMEADSQAHRDKVEEWYYSVALTRLSPMASIILVQTRWHPQDLSGIVIDGESQKPRSARRWRHINIPAMAEEGIPDALGRDYGTYLVSARDRTPEEFEATRADVGDRVWYALYQGSPRNPKGGLFEKAWFEPKAAPPAWPVASVVGIDPADSGEGDECGLIGASLASDGTIVLVEDWSGQMTSDQWAKKAIQMALTLGAREISMEAYATATTYVNVIKTAWKDIQREVREKVAAGDRLDAWEERAQIADMPFVIHKWTGRGDAVGRAAMLRQALETRKCRTVATKLAVFENHATDWQVGQHCPDRVSAGIIAHDRLDILNGGRATMAAPIDGRGTASDVPGWMTRRLDDRGAGPMDFMRGDRIE